MRQNLTIICGDAATALQSLPAETFQTCVTSPPYWGLRDYGADGQIGREGDPEAYVESLVRVFREVRRVLATDGTLWLNLGDSYAGSAGGLQGKRGCRADRRFTPYVQPKVGHGLKQKDLVGIPWAVAFALRSDGWYLRSDIIWSKPNAMPSSVRDRPTLAHEYIFLMAKSDRYFYNADAIAEPAKYPEGPWGGRNARPGVDTNGGNQQHGVIRAKKDTRNKRTVWTVSTQPFKGAHFATFPPKLIRPCILAGSRPGDLVLDPFNGAGTTGQVALQLQRRYVGVEINPEYVAITRARLAEVQRELFVG